MLHNVEHMSRRPGQTKTLGEFEQMVLLALLRLGENAYGATVWREIEMRTGRALSLSAVYTTLERLERKRLVRSWVGEPTPERGGRRRKHYALEPAGAELLSQSVGALRGMVAGLEKALGRL